MARSGAARAAKTSGRLRSSAGGGSGGSGGSGGAGGSGSFSVFRLIPIVLLPAAVLSIQAIEGEIKLPLVSVALALGVFVAAQAKGTVVTCLSAIVLAGVLMSIALLQELQQQSPLQPEAPPRRGPLRPLPPAVDGDGGGGAASAMAEEHVAAGATAERAQATPEELVAAGAFAERASAMPEDLFAAIDDAEPAAVPVEKASAGGLAEVELSPTTLETMSVVLPCAYEGRFAARTVEAVRQNTRQERLKEIIVVDDGSMPPLSQELPELALRGSGAPVRLIRHEKTLGLIAAKKTGGDAATGDVIVFFDCHVKPRMGWEEAFLEQMQRLGDHRTVVVPTITSLDPTTWTEMGSGSSKACYMTWNGDFTWLPDTGHRDVPLMSGGLLALSRQWWQETEGYDPNMVAWGGENIDQSLRTWLCGGRIEVALGAFVAHMWRDPKNPETKLKYPMKTQDVMRNKARAVSAWLDEFKEKTFTFPEYEDFVSGKQSIGDMSIFDNVKRKLKCAPFATYIRRFPYVYLDSGLIPDEVYQLREESSGRCLERSEKDGAILAPCVDETGAGSGGVPELQLWHGANKDKDSASGSCCSGIVNWNFLQCLNTNNFGGGVECKECDISGRSRSQAFSLNDDVHSGQLVWKTGMGCVVPQPTKLHAEEGLQGCSIKAVITGDDPDSFRLKRESDGMCIESQQEKEDEFRLHLVECTESDDQVFTSVSMLGGLGVWAGTSTKCLDSAGGGASPLIYQCYSEEDGNKNQVWQLRGNALVWESPASKSLCVHAAEGSTEITFKEVPSSSKLELRTCAAKRGQRLRRYNENNNEFLLRDEDTGKCLGANDGGNLFLGECKDQRWRELPDRKQLQHIQTEWCADAGDEISPIVYPCHVPVAERKQRFRVTGAGVQLQGDWADNGRKRFFDKCLDHSPEPPTKVHVDGCDAAAEQGVRWTKINSRVPVERKLWDKVH